ncbi:hypothetical protein [Sphingopyxis sp. FD7]|uniref:hypothetical protein n=1 Tax=Sphingopyxis sp. FD7 TaxID=1914525 RepID=UPI000DC634AE|nr:hypothetical protein [Sphingopyxis sp. FD7]BBB11877.1 TonB-dependent receptor [Sphingopyxis sp. FD7]
MTKSHLLMGAAAFAVAISVSQPVFAQQTEDSTEATEDADNPERDCQEFRVWAGIMGEKESHYVSTQRTCDPV